jgi:hypothetical protein
MSVGENEKGERGGYTKMVSRLIKEKNVGGFLCHLRENYSAER